MSISQKKGHWIIDSDSNCEFALVRCSECGFETKNLYMSDSVECPHCCCDMLKHTPENHIVKPEDEASCSDEIIKDTKYFFTVSMAMPIVEDGKIVNTITSHNGEIYDNVMQAESNCLALMLNCLSTATVELNKNVSKVVRELHAHGCPIYMVKLDDHDLWYSVDPLEYKSEDSEGAHVKQLRNN